MSPVIWSRRSVGAVLALGTAGSLLLLSAVAPAGAATGPHPGKVAVPQGINAAALGKPVFPTNSKTKETVSFVLKARHLSALKSTVLAGMPGGFLSVAQFAHRYGEPASDIHALQSYLHDFGITSSAYSDGLDVTAHGTAGQFNNALSVTQQEYAVKAVAAHDGQAARPARVIHGTKDAPLLPVKLARFVESILGLTNYPIFSSNAVRTPTLEKPSTAHGLQLGNQTPADFAKQYGLTPLYKKGASGQGQTIGIVTLASLRPSDATHFWSKLLKLHTKANRIKLDNIDGGSGKVSNDSGSGETTLDVEQSGALARNANIIVYQAPNTDYGFLDGFFAAASQNKASTVSSSWGESENALEVTAAAGEETATYGQANDEVFLELAAQGQSSFIASGDDGAYDAFGDIGTTNLSVDTPGNSPYTTDSGGTTLAGRIPLFSQITGLQAATVTIKSQRAWGWDWLWPHYALFETSNGTPYTSEAQFAVDPENVGGSGGGYSKVEARPSYQDQIKNIGDFTAVPYLTPTAYAPFPGTSITLPTAFKAWDSVSNSPVPPKTVTGQASGRAVPDLSADADPFTGYEEYFTQFPKSVHHLEAGWGGTSFVAPQLNGSTAVIDSYLGHRVGLWNTAIYKFAVGANSPFTPLDSANASNDNLYYAGTAGHLFNPGTGLGTPNLAKLASDFRELHR